MDPHCVRCSSSDSDGKVLGTTDYLGSRYGCGGTCSHGWKGSCICILLKIIFTAVTLGCGFRGWRDRNRRCLLEQPLMSVRTDHRSVSGAGSSLRNGSSFLWCPNCPISSMFLSFELFGFESMPFVLLTVAISYLESGYFGLYHSQKILYSKTKLKFINTHTKE